VSFVRLSFLLRHNGDHVRIRSCRGSLPQDLLSDASIDSLAEQVGVAVVAGILLDHVDQ